MKLADFVNLLFRAIPLPFVVEMDDDVETRNPYAAFVVDANGNDYSCVYTPEVAEEYIPKVDQIFESL